ncbi:MAG: FAD/NAD(P)-binding protein [Sphingomonas sp.]|nr:FAD/NAD(P)-binding protein [Sphingomonas sp.]
MRSDRHWPVAIIGGGFSGTIAAAQLARRGVASVVIEAGDRAGLGAAYSTTDPAHLLNVPAGNMSAWADVPDDFVRRVGDPGIFAERRQFGTYLRSILDETVGSGCTTLVADRAVGARHTEDGWTVALEKQETVTASALVLATGNQPPGRLAALEGAGDRLISNPWGREARAAIADLAATGAPVLVVGTGLTMVDVVLSLQGAGHGGPILALSRRGLIPRGHAACDPAPVEFAQVPAGSSAGLLSWLRSRGAEVGWRAAIDSLRPHSQALWQSLGATEQRRFLRHARPWWDVHRHRIAPQVAGMLVDLIARGRLQVAAGRVQSCRRTEAGVEVAIARRSRGGAMTGEFAYLFNCTGPLHAIGATGDPLLKRLIDDGHARPDQLGIGLAVDDRSRVDGAERLWAIGPLTKGAFWEIIAVPDIRDQAAAVADDISRELA